MGPMTFLFAGGPANLLFTLSDALTDWMRRRICTSLADKLETYCRPIGLSVQWSDLIVTCASKG